MLFVDMLFGRWATSWRVRGRRELANCFFMQSLQHCEEYSRKGDSPEALVRVGERPPTAGARIPPPGFCN